MGVQYGFVIIFGGGYRMSLELGFAPEREQIKEVKMTPEVLENFIQHNKFAVTEANLRDRCVDGRYEGDELAAISKPGGSAGDVMAAFGAMNLLGKQLQNEVVLNAVISSVGGIEKFAFHTDEGSEHDQAGCGMGCGHMKKAKLEPEDYKVTQDQMDFLFARLPGLLAESAEQVVLNGDHKETAVVVVRSEGYGLAPKRLNEGVLEEAFVYQKTLHEQQLDRLSKQLQEALAAAGEVVEEPEIRHKLDEAFAFQLGATLSRLAKGLPIYEAEILDDETKLRLLS